MSQGRFSELSLPRQTLIRLCQTINYGYIENLAVRDREPIYVPSPGVLVDVKLHHHEAPRPEGSLVDFEVAREARRPSRRLDEGKKGRIGKTDAAVDRMCGSIREFGFKIPVLARSDGEVVDGHLRLKAARKLGITEVPVILCDEWTPAQVKAFRIMVNRSVTWADWDEELLAIELQELNASDFDLSLTGFDPREIDGLLAIPEA